MFQKRLLIVPHFVLIKQNRYNFAAYQPLSKKCSVCFLKRPFLTKYCFNRGKIVINIFLLQDKEGIWDFETPNFV
jgi:hypothetical protein